jgi:hypothetical protein
VVPWSTQVQLMFGFTAPVTNRPLLYSNRLLPEDSRSWLRAQLNHFHHMVVARRAMENWCLPIRLSSSLGGLFDVGVPVA